MNDYDKVGVFLIVASSSVGSMLLVGILFHQAIGYYLGLQSLAAICGYALYKIDWEDNPIPLPMLILALVFQILAIKTLLGI